jgi:hypothetical protein
VYILDFAAHEGFVGFSLAFQLIERQQAHSMANHGAT